MLDFSELERKGATIPNVVKKLYNDITPQDNLAAILSKSGLSEDNAKNSLRMLTDVEKAVRDNQRVPPPPGGYRALKVLQNVFSSGRTISNIGYTLSHNKRQITLIVVGVAVGALTGGLGIAVLGASTLGTYAAGAAWRRWGHVALRRKGNMDFDPNNREDYADIEKHITTWQDRIVKRQMTEILQKMHFQQRCRNDVNPNLLVSYPVTYRNCGEWIAALEAVCRLRKITEEVHLGFKDIVHFWGLLTFELIDRQEKFAARISHVMTTINTQIQRGGHKCTYGTSWFGDGSASRKLSGGICYEWKTPDGAHLGGPIYPKHTLNPSVMWEARLRTDKDSLFMKLLQDATTWGNLIETAITGGQTQLPGRLRSRLARSVDMFSGGKPDRASDISDLFPTVFTNTGEKWLLAGTANTTPPTATGRTLATQPLSSGSTGTDIAVETAVQTLSTGGASSIGKVVGGLGSSLVSGTSAGANIAASFNPTAVVSSTNLFGNVMGSASHAVNIGAGYATAGLSIVLEVLNFADNNSLVTRGRHLIGIDATVSELVTAHTGVLKDHFGAIATAWKGYRKADDALMNLGALTNCNDAFVAAANLIRREMYYRETVRLYQTLWVFVCLVGSTHGAIIQELEDGNPEVIAKLKDWLTTGHASTHASGQLEEICQGYCYRAMTDAISVLYKADAPQAVTGAPVRPIGLTASTRT